MSDLVRAERSTLADALTAAGPDAPTLCEGWDAQDLVAHLVVREHRPLAALGIVVAPLASLHDDAIRRAEQRHGFDALVRTFRAGPPLWWRPIDGVANLQELFVHHEDLRRGAGDTAARPTDEIAALEAALWASLRRGAGFATRGLKGLRVVLVDPDGDRIEARKSGPELTVTGRPGEIVLWLFGRGDAAHVELGGDPDAVARARTASLGI